MSLFSNSRDSDYNSIDFIRPNLAISSYACAYDINLVKQCGITRVISLDDFPHSSETLKQYAQLKIQQLWFPIEDKPTVWVIPTLEKVKDCIKKFHSEGHKVLVHCRLGKSRAVAAVALFLMSFEQIRCQRAMEVIKQARQIAYPNEGFLEQLRLYSQAHGYETVNPPPRLTDVEELAQAIEDGERGLNLAREERLQAGEQKADTK